MSYSLQPGHATDSGQSPTGLTLNLSSNNPFRNRAASPASLESPSYFSKPASPFDDPPARPLSRNPFLDQAPAPAPAQPLRSPGVMSTQSDSKSLSAEEIFDSLTLDDKQDRKKQPPPPGGPRRPMDRPPARRPSEHARPAPPPEGQHRPTRSQEEALRARRMQGAGGPRPPASQSPNRRPQQRRPRRNSESSVRDFELTEEEKRHIAERRRGGGRDGKKSGRPSRKMDIIDQLDATSIYGTGLFHHDGPFDALNPHRNRPGAKSRLAPMQAFPKDSLNNSLGGAGPLNSQADHSAFMGISNDEAFRDFSGKANGYVPPRREPVIFDAAQRGSIVHGDHSEGLGSTTFLEGTPAARSAIARSQQEQTRQNLDGGGLQRKKSLAQRFRGINKTGNAGGSRPMAEGGYTRISPETTPSAMSAGSDNNPFFNEFGKGEESISVRPQDRSPPRERRAPPPAGLVLERRATTEATTTVEDKPSGLLGRMKSLKGGRRPREGSTGNSAPGTAV